MAAQQLLKSVYALDIMYIYVRRTYVFNTRARVSDLR